MPEQGETGLFPHRVDPETGEILVEEEAQVPHIVSDKEAESVLARLGDVHSQVVAFTAGFEAAKGQAEAIVAQVLEPLPEYQAATAKMAHCHGRLAIAKKNLDYLRQWYKPLLAAWARTRLGKGSRTYTTTEGDVAFRALQPVWEVTDLQDFVIWATQHGKLGFVRVELSQKLIRDYVATLPDDQRQIPGLTLGPPRESVIVKLPGESRP